MNTVSVLGGGWWDKCRTTLTYTWLRTNQFTGIHYSMLENKVQVLSFSHVVFIMSLTWKTQLQTDSESWSPLFCHAYATDHPDLLVHPVQLFRSTIPHFCRRDQQTNSRNLPRAEVYTVHCTAIIIYMYYNVHYDALETSIDAIHII